MYCKVHRPVNTPGVSDNKGKCVQLVEYLSKELKEERPYYDNFFSQKEDYVTPLTVMHHMDNNHRTLKRNDDKFYMLTINPSGEEQQHLIEKVTECKTADSPKSTKDDGHDYIERVFGREKIGQRVSFGYSQERSQKGKNQPSEYALHDPIRLPTPIFDTIDGDITTRLAKGANGYDQ